MNDFRVVYISMERNWISKDSKWWNTCSNFDGLIDDQHSMKCPFSVDYSQPQPISISIVMKKRLFLPLKNIYIFCIKQFCLQGIKQNNSPEEQRICTSVWIFQPKQIYIQKVWILSARGGDLRLI